MLGGRERPRGKRECGTHKLYKPIREGGKRRRTAGGTWYICKQKSLSSLLKKRRVGGSIGKGGVQVVKESRKSPSGVEERTVKKRGPKLWYFLSTCVRERTLKEVGAEDGERGWGTKE